jgi:hypothetical protein
MAFSKLLVRIVQHECGTKEFVGRHVVLLTAIDLRLVFPKTTALRCQVASLLFSLLEWGL